MLIGEGETKKTTENDKKSDWERRKENRTGRKFEGDGTESWTGHCRENLSSRKKNENSGKMWEW